ncbi:hypothetical protein [Roseibium sp.]|uniref:hypothetical protein n=1 Tax=Roseibium sp. TaxID=1936156 RepID=UPI003A96E325
MTKVRFRPAFKFPGAVLLCFVFLAASAFALPASAQGTPRDGAISSSRLEHSDASAARNTAPADDDGTLDTGDRGLLDSEARAPADCSDGFDDVAATAFSQAGGTDFIRSLSLLEDNRIRAIWLGHRSPVAWIDDGSPRIYARPPPVIS